MPALGPIPLEPRPSGLDLRHYANPFAGAPQIYTNEGCSNLNVCVLLNVLWEAHRKSQISSVGSSNRSFQAQQCQSV